MRKSLYYFCFLTLLTSGDLLAQPYFDPVNFHHISSPVATNTGSTINYLSIQTGLPIKLKNDLLIFNPFFEQYKLSFEQADFSQSFNSIGLPLTFLKEWKNKKWKTAFVFIPRINSDFRAISGKDYQFGGAVLAIYKKKENLKYKFSSVLFGGINFKSITNSYRFDGSPYLKISDNYLKLFLDCYLTKTVVATVEAGHSVLRKYKIGNEGVATDLSDIKDGLLLKAGLAYRIRLTEKK